MIFKDPDRRWPNSVGSALWTCGSGREVEPAGNFLLLSPFSAYDTDGLVVDKLIELHNKPFALVTERHGQAILFATNAIAEQEGLNPGMKLADARAIFPKLSVEPTQIQKDKAMLEKIRIWY